MAKENDIVLVYFEDQPLVFARIEEICADIKKDWYHVRLLLLQVPLETVTWILKDAYINGEEFTMGGNRMRLERVVAPEEKFEDKKDQSPGPKSANGKVVSLSDRKPKT